MTDVGRTGEAVAAKYYQQRGWLLLNHNYRTRLGELDLILYKENTLVFAEVKTRTGAMLDRPAAAVEWVRTHASLIAPSAILVDLCGVKRTVVSAITPIARERGFAYIGGHPMAGRERGGFTASSEDLYVGASMILTPDQRTDMQLLETLKIEMY